MPAVAIRMDVEGREEVLTEFFCDWPDCPNAAVEVVGVRELRMRTMLCREHSEQIANQARRDQS